uniref:Uncharacterized protein n=1 Tax=Arundo donax TaxID=35708 RepID=A0A0A9E6N2_ARUDO
MKTQKKKALCIQLAVKAELPPQTHLVQPKLHREEPRCKSTKKYTPHPTQSCGKCLGHCHITRRCKCLDLTSIVLLICCR